MAEKTEPKVPVQQASDRVGSTPRTDPEAFTYTNAPQIVTAKDLRDAGYEVPETVKDDDPPGTYIASTVRTDAEPFLVQDLSAQHLILHDETPAEHAAKGPAGKGGPVVITTLGTTPARQAVKDSKGSDAEKQGPRPPAKVLDGTPSESAGTPSKED